MVNSFYLDIKHALLLSSTAKQNNITYMVGKYRPYEQVVQSWISKNTIVFYNTLQKFFILNNGCAKYMLIVFKKTSQ